MEDPPTCLQELEGRTISRVILHLRTHASSPPSYDDIHLVRPYEKVANSRIHSQLGAYSAASGVK